MDKKTIENMIGGLTLLIIVMALLGFSVGTIDFIVNIIIKYVIISAIFSYVVENLVENLTGDTFKKILIPIKIKGFKFSLSVFVIIVFILKFCINH